MLEPIFFIFRVAFALPFLAWLVSVVANELIFKTRTPQPGKPDRSLLPILRGKVVLVTGASQGIGRDLACLYAGHGCKVVLASRNPSKLDEVKKQMVGVWGAKESDVLVIPYDGSAPIGTSSALIDRVVSHFGALDILVLNHIKSVFEPLLPPELHPNTPAYAEAVKRMIKETDETIRTNAVAYMELALSALPHLRDSSLQPRNNTNNQKWRAQIVVASSASALMPTPNVHSYAASKSCINTWFDDLRLELQCNKYYKDLIKINSMLMGAIDSEGFRGTPLVNNETVMKTVEKTIDAAWRMVAMGFRGSGVVTIPGAVLNVFPNLRDIFANMLYPEDVARAKVVDYSK